MRAAILREYGADPEFGEFDDPQPGDGHAVAEVLVAGLNPIDLRLATGQLSDRRPPLPSVVCREGVALLDGRRVYFDGVPAPFGAAAELAPVDPESVVDVPDDLDEAQAVCFGIAGLAAWLALERRAELQPGETVLVLGASGMVGMIGVQVARLLGAWRVVAAARSDTGLARAKKLGADATVRLDGHGAILTTMFKTAAGGDVDVVLDPLWGGPAAAALEALGFRGRLVQLGQSASAVATFPSVAVRFRELSILGHTNFAAPPEARRAALERMFAHAAAGELVADYEELPLSRVGEGWRRQADSPNVKLVLRP
jgi:NADPH:quinone reductase-like Zn-dependent oxidoreductase